MECSFCKSKNHNSEYQEICSFLENIALKELKKKGE